MTLAFTWVMLSARRLWDEAGHQWRMGHDVPDSNVTETEVESLPSELLTMDSALPYGLL